MTHAALTSLQPAPEPGTLPTPANPARRRRRLLALAVGWFGTRAIMLWLLARDGRDPIGVGGIAHEVYGLYFHWYGVLVRGGFPAGDPKWQYPPGAGPVLLSPAVLPWLTYFQAFVALTLATDALITLALVRAGLRPGRGTAGAALWTAGLPLLLHIPLARYDVQVTALAVFALLALSHSPRAGGMFAALGALMKVWPALTLLGTPWGRTTREAWTAAAVSAGVLLTVLMVAFHDPFAFLAEQGGRGVQIESVGGTALSFAKRAGWAGHVVLRYGAMEFTGPYVSLVTAASLALTLAAFGLLLVWRLRAVRWTEATPYDAALAAVLLFTVTSRVISPQYLVWLIGLAAVCLTSRHTTQRPVAALIVLATAVSAVAYPAFYREVTHCTLTGCLLMLVRNALLAGAALLSFRRLWRSTLAGASAAGGPSTLSSRALPT